MDKSISIFLSGDVMTGRGIDQILPHPSDPKLYESYIKNARDYVKLAEQHNGRIPKPVDFGYIWNYGLGVIKEADLRIINLETSITKSNDYADKGINYRMHPDNIPCLTSAKIDCCVLANNHVLDWGEKGLLETLGALEQVNIQTTGAGRNDSEAKQPAVLSVVDKGTVLVFGYGMPSSGIPEEWKAGEGRPGLNVVNPGSVEAIETIAQEIKPFKTKGNLVVVSLHWGGNWGYEITKRQRDFAHELIDKAGADIIHGHSSHHIMGIEVYKGKPILYGCGDLINDYEGISGHEQYRGDLGLMYFIDWDRALGSLASLHMVPTQLRKFQLNRPRKKDANWLRGVLNREGKQFGTEAVWVNEDTLALTWD